MVRMACFDVSFLFLELNGVGGNKGQRTLEAKQFFEMVHGFDCSTTPIRDASECLGKADLVYCDTKALAKEAWPLVRNGAFMCTSEELADVPILWKGQEKQLYKKD